MVRKPNQAAQLNEKAPAEHLDNDTLYQSLQQFLDRISYVKPEQIPDLELYMDQVTGFMEERLRKVKRHPDDKVLTKTMINNYTKARILPPPVKKKYSKEHVFMLLFVYYYKGILSLDDLSTVLSRLNTSFFGSQENGADVEKIYREVFAMEASQMEVLKNDLKQKYALSRQTFGQDKAAFAGLSTEERDHLQLFSFICELAFDVYLKKLMMEKLCDAMKADQQSQAR